MKDRPIKVSAMQKVEIHISRNKVSSIGRFVTGIFLAFPQKKNISTEALKGQVMHEKDDIQGIEVFKVSQDIF